MAAEQLRVIEPEEVVLSLDRIGLAMAVIRDAGYPTTDAEHAEVLRGAREMMAESFRRRGIPDPPGGWTVAALSATAWWRPWLSPEVALQVDGDLRSRPPGAVVVVLFATALGEPSKWM